MISSYICEIMGVLLSGNTDYFPNDLVMRKNRNIALAHDIGYGLGIYEKWRDYAESLYYSVITKMSQDDIGVRISKTEWMEEIKIGHNRYTGGK